MSEADGGERKVDPSIREAMAGGLGAERKDGALRVPPEWLHIARRRIALRQSRVTLALDEDVATFFRSMGRGHQGRMNDVLRAFMLSCQQGWLPMVGFEGGREAHSEGGEIRAPETAH